MFFHLLRDMHFFDQDLPSLGRSIVFIRVPRWDYQPEKIEDFGSGRVWWGGQCGGLSGGRVGRLMPGSCLEYIAAGKKHLQRPITQLYFTLRGKGQVQC